MPNNPVQVILNTNAYQELPEGTGGGSVKDFYAGRNQAFAIHRDSLLAEVDQIQRRVSRAGSAGLEYAHVVLNEDAWAKSRRPTQRIFPPNRVPLVGGNQLGDMIVELTPETLDIVRGSISSAEIEVELAPDRRTNELRPKPSRERGEVGAIKSIRPHRAADRRSFSAQEAVDWLADPRTGGMYLVETFVDPGKVEDAFARRVRARALTAYERLTTQLKELDLPLTVEDTGARWQSMRLLLIRLETTEVQDHESLLRFLDESPIVHRISLPPIVTAEHAAMRTSSETLHVPAPDATGPYPVLAIVDTGVATLPALDGWCVGRTDPLAGTDQDRSHGTFIAGLSAAANSFNTHPVFEEVPCKFFDLGLHPTDDDAYDDFYPRGFIDFLEQLDAEIPAAKAAGARVFNMSLSIQRQIDDDDYSQYATLLDEIADRHDVVFVLPSGNLKSAVWRPVWPAESALVAEMLAGYRYAGTDRIFQPAESVRAVSVGALDLPDDTNGFRPSVYTRRGPSLALGVKPNVAHIGGRGGRDPDLVSLAVDGNRTTGCGTSYAAPLAAKTLAALDHLIEGDVDREMLVGLLIHHADLPPPLNDPRTARYAVDFAGHGLPAAAVETLITADHTITLAFVGKLRRSHELIFPLTWPASLVSGGGKCRGDVRLTLAYRAPTNRRFGAEYVRVNLDAYLRQEKVDQETGEISWKGQLRSEGKIYERHLIEHGHKWWPIKRYQRRLSGVGDSSTWRLVVDSLCRTDTEFPEDGVPFAVILTIEDQKATAPIFTEVRQTLINSGVEITDIRTAQRIVARP